MKSAKRKTLFITALALLGTMNLYSMGEGLTDTNTNGVPLQEVQSLKFLCAKTLVKNNKKKKEVQNLLHDDARDFFNILLKCKSNNKKTLFQAAKTGTTAIIPDLLAAGININTQDKKTGKTPLHHASENERKETVDCLLDKLADPNAQDKKGLTPLHLAIKNGNKEIFYQLLAAKASIKIETKLGKNAIHFAARFNQPTMLKELLDRQKTLLKRYKKEALDNPDKEVALELKDMCGRTLLHLVAIYNAEEACKILIENSANVAAQSSSSKTPIHYAAEYGSLEVLTLLIEKDKSSIDITTNNGETPLHLAAQNRKFEAVKCLVENGAMVDVSEKTALECVINQKLSYEKELKKVEKTLKTFSNELEKLTKKSETLKKELGKTTKGKKIEKLKNNLEKLETAKKTQNEKFKTAKKEREKITQNQNILVKIDNFLKEHGANTTFIKSALDKIEFCTTY